MATNLQEEQHDDSDQTVHLCDLCSEDEVQNAAEAFCEVCNQFFCANCLKFHERNRATKTHHVLCGAEMFKLVKIVQADHADIVGTREKLPGFSAKNDSSSIKQACRFHPSETLGHFCEVHKVVTCVACNIVDHRNCKIVGICEKTSDVNFNEKAQKTLKDAQDLFAQFENLEAKYITHASETKLQKETFAKNLEAKNRENKHQITNCLNELESTFNNLTEKEMHNLEMKIKDIDNIKSVVQNQTEAYKNVLQKGSNEQKRVMTMVIEADIRKYCENLDEIRQNCFTISTENVFNKVDSLDPKLTDLEANINIAKVPVQRPFQDRKVSLIGEVDISETSGGMSKIIGLEIISDDQMLVCDQKRQKVILLNINYNDLQIRQHHSVGLSSVPYSMTLMDDTTAFVSTNDNSIQKVKIIDGKSLVVTETIELDHQYIRLVKYEQNMIAYERTDTESIVVSVINQNGEQIRLVTNDPEKYFQSVGFVCLSPGKDIIYITVKKHGCIGISMAGKMVFKYKADGVQYYQGVSTDSEGYIYLAEGDTENIVVVNNKGEKVTDLFTSKGMHPNYMTFNEMLDKLFVVKGKTGKIMVFNMDG